MTAPPYLEGGVARLSPPAPCSTLVFLLVVHLGVLHISMCEEANT